MCYYLIVDTMKSTHESLELAQGLDFLHRHDDGVCRNVSGQVGATGWHHLYIPLVQGDA